MEKSVIFVVRKKKLFGSSMIYTEIVSFDMKLVSLPNGN